MSTCVKIQRSILTTASVDQVLIYNKSASIFYEGPLSADIAKFMGSNLKIYALANVSKSGEISILRAVKAQNW